MLARSNLSNLSNLTYLKKAKKVGINEVIKRNKIINNSLKP